MKSERLEITDDKKPITTDHNGFPLKV